MRSLVPQESLPTSVLSAAHFEAVPRTQGAWNWRVGRHLRRVSPCRLMAALCKPVTPAVCRDEATRPAIPAPAGVVSPPLPGCVALPAFPDAPLCPPVNTVPTRAEIARGPARSAAWPATPPLPPPTDARRSSPPFRHSQQLSVHVKRDQRNMPAYTSLRILSGRRGLSPNSSSSLALSSLPRTTRPLPLSLSPLPAFLHHIFCHIGQFACTLVFIPFPGLNMVVDVLYSETFLHYPSPNIYRS